MWNRLLCGVLLSALICITEGSMAQCCSTGSPVGASTHVGLVNKNTVRAIAFYRHSFSDIYYEGSKPSDDETDMADNAHYDYTGITLEYGLTHRITLQADAGYFINKVVNFHNPALTDHNGRGMSNGTFMLKYGLYVDPVREVEITAGVGFKFPFSRQPATAENGTLLQLDARPSTNAFGVTGSLLLSKEFTPLTLRTFILNRFEYNGFNVNDYQTGKLLTTSVFVSKKIARRFFGIVQLRNEIHGRDVQDGENEVNTGYHLMVFTPQISYVVVGLWNVSLLYDVPVYKNYKGKQLTPQYSYAISLSRDFSIRKAK
jgi:hypothetical protein